MNKQTEVLRILKIAGRHGMNKLFAAQYLHVFGLGEIISRLKRKGYNIKTFIVNRNKDNSHVKYILGDVQIVNISKSDLCSKHQGECNCFGDDSKEHF